MAMSVAFFTRSVELSLVGQSWLSCSPLFHVGGGASPNLSNLPKDNLRSFCLNTNGSPEDDLFKA